MNKNRLRGDAEQDEQANDWFGMVCEVGPMGFCALCLTTAARFPIRRSKCSGAVAGHFIELRVLAERWRNEVMGRQALLSGLFVVLVVGLR
jgi:hypothetical protein